jgi:nitroreductase
MSVSDRAAAAAPYLQAVLDDDDVRDALRRAMSAGRDTYRRARGKSPSNAVKDKPLRRRAQQAAIASWQLVAAIDAAQAPRRPRRGRRRAMFAVAVLAGSYGAYLVSTGDAREALQNLLNHNASSESSNGQ